jgi:two-component system, LytTR family, response regulator AlgR
MRVLIVDDEPPARDRLRRLSAEIAAIECVGEAANGVEALALAESTRADVVLLDIRMPGMDGIEVARHLATFEQPPAVIFTTAFDQYALAAFDAQAVGYLLKPVRRERLESALQKAARLTRPQLARIAAAAQLGQKRGHIAARLKDKVRLIPLEDIYCLIADQKYTTVHHKGGSDLIEDSLKALEEEFATEFVRVHRNSLVALRHLAAVERTADGHYQARVRDTELTLPVSRRLAADVLRRL